MLPRNSSFRKVLVLFSFLETFCTRVGNSEGHSQAYIQTDKDLLDAVPISMSQSFSEDQTFSYQDDEGTITVLGSPIRFEPPHLNFQEQSVGVPGLRKVTVHNINGHSSIQMLSISGNTIHFHCSFFADKVIPPGGNTTFDVVFLGREEGVVENTLYIHTSAGSFRYNVFGTGTPNPYRIKPLVGIRMPLNSSYSPLIELHNPHPSTIQVLEMYSSGGDLHLELPGGETEGESGLWQIPPYHTKPVMKANFLARLENNHTAYIRIKTNTTGAEFLYLPLEVEVSSQPGIYCPQEMIDFGLMSSDSGPRTLDLLVLNAGSRPLSVASVVTTPVTDAVSINFSTVKVQPDTVNPTVVAQITFNPSTAKADGVHMGKLLVKSKNSQFKVTLPYKAHVLRGSLSWNETMSRFLLTDKPNPDDPSHAPVITTARNVTITNKFAVPIVVHSIKLAQKAEEFFTIESFKPKVIGPGETEDLVLLTVKSSAWSGDRRLSSYLTLHTNLTNVQIPLLCFDGKLEHYFPSSPSESTLDFGTIGMNEKRDMYFALLNKGPVRVVLRGWGGNITGSLIELMGVAEGNETNVVARQNYSDMQRRLYVSPDHYVVYRIGILSGSTEGEYHAQVFVSTEYEEIAVPFRFRVARGSLSTSPQQLYFATAFPGKSSHLKLLVHSSFRHKMRVKSLSVVGGDPRFSFSLGEDGDGGGGGVLVPGQKSYVGQVSFDPGATCRITEDCYTGFPPSGKFGHPWYLGLALPLNLGDMDLAVVHSLWSRMRATALPHSMFNVTLRLDTSEVRGFLFTARAALSWPVLSASPVVTFPLTQLGNTTTREVVLTNPSSEPLLVHLVPMSAYPSANTVLKLLPNRIKLPVDSIDQQQSTTNENSSLFTIVSVKDAAQPCAPLPAFGQDFATKFGVGVSPDTHPVVLAPGQKAVVTVSFAPEGSPGLRSSVLFVRNNLTGLDVVDLVGTGATGEIKFGNRKAGSTIHAFEMTEKHLKDCDKVRSSKYNLPNLTVKRPFTARNTGEVPLWVTGFDIDGTPCEGYGFKVLDCEPFELPANDSRKINIAFTPDFTLSRVARTLTIRTSLGADNGDIRYALAATVPAHLLTVCSSAIPRPNWEIFLYYGCLSLLGFSLFIVLVAAFFESDRILKYCFILAAPGPQPVFNPETTRLLDLKAVGRAAAMDIDKAVTKREMVQIPKTSTNKMISATSKATSEPAKSDLKGNTLCERDEKSENWFYRFFSKFVSTLSSYGASSPTPGTPPDCSSSPTLSSSTSSPKGSIIKSTAPVAVKKKLESTVSSPVNNNNNSAVKNNKKKSRSVEPTTTAVVKARQKVVSQSSVNDELDTSSTTTESSNPDDLNESFPKGISNSDLNFTVPDHTSAQPGKNKKRNKNKSSKTETSVEANNLSGNERKPTTNKPKKALEKQDSKQAETAKTEKPKLSPKSSTDTVYRPASATAPSPPPKKQQAKVKGVQKEQTSQPDNRRPLNNPQQPQYDRPPRLQQSFNRAPTETQQPPQPLDGFPTLTVGHNTTAPLAKPDPPRAIILPERKPENLGSQFGPIGCKVPLSRKSTWSDSPAQAQPARAGMFSTPPPEVVPQPEFPSSGLMLNTSVMPPNMTMNMSMMQRLQAQRKYEREEHARRQRDNWPGFDQAKTNSYIESLWDAPGQQATNNSGTDGGLLGATIGNVWPSTMFGSTGVFSGEQEQGVVGGGAKEGEEGGLGFDPLALSSIWSSPNSQKKAVDDTWSSQLFNKEM